MEVIVNPRKKLNLLPDIGDVIFLGIMQLLLFLLPCFLFTDGSIGWHFVAGRHILLHGSLPSHDLISYTITNRQWFDDEWLSDVVMSWFHSATGVNGIAVLFSVAIATLFLLLYERCRDTGCNFIMATLLTVSGVLAASIHFLARPHIFTFWGVYIFSTTLNDYYKARISFKRMSFLLSIFMLIWVNMHPGFVLALVLTAIYAMVAMCKIAISSQPKAAQKMQALQLSLLFVGLSLIGLINPWGWDLYKHILNYLSIRSVLAATSEYQPPLFNGDIQTSCLELLFFFLLFGLAFRKARASSPQLISVIVFACMALSSNRHVPLFVIVALPFIADCFANLKPIFISIPLNKFVLSVNEKWTDFNNKFNQIELRSRLHLLPILLVAILSIAALSGGRLFNRQVLNSDFDSKFLPTKTLTYLSDNKLIPTEGFNLDNWGGYIRYKLGFPVFIDDRTAYYGERFYLNYAQISLVNPGWAAALDKNNIRWVLFPRNSRLAASLMESSKWKIACEDRAAYLFIRN